ncbi:transporter [Aequorivita sp. H23M31]|uniref:Transporter n=1 Tax=Aequorivita ciconiae TaxID=2494375 RepID=A0A410FZJ3_9FLAO|nr:transporter [Aequorivita sp. H23M31]QAA80426.1 transporter [Aequorivita sp. H23M31]
MSTHFRLLFFLCLFPFSTVLAQYTDMINANRPGVSQGAFAVGRGILQFETGFSYGKEKHSLRKTETQGMGLDYAIRYGVFKEQFEISLIGEYESQNITYNPNTKQRIANFKSNTLGIKHLLYDPYKEMYKEKPNLYSWRKNNTFQWADLVPAVALYMGLNVDFPDNPLTQKNGSTISPKFMLTTQNNWVGGWVFVTNLIADWGTTSSPSYGYIVTLTHATNRYFSIFIENQGIKNDWYADQLLRGGAAALINPDFQVDLSFTTSFKDTPSKLYGRLGLAYRLDFHKQEEYLYDDVPEGEEKDQLKKSRDAQKKKDRLRRKLEREERIRERKERKNLEE